MCAWELCYREHVAMHGDAGYRQLAVCPTEQRLQHSAVCRLYACTFRLSNCKFFTSLIHHIIPKIDLPQIVSRPTPRISHGITANLDIIS